MKRIIQTALLASIMISPLASAGQWCYGTPTNIRIHVNHCGPDNVAFEYYPDGVARWLCGTSAVAPLLITTAVQANWRVAAYFENRTDCAADAYTRPDMLSIKP